MQSSGDARLDLWEERCTCGGSRKSPDVRMCICEAPSVAGLVCGKCGRGVLLIKAGPRGNFWGCSNFKKGGCKNTKPFGPPHDRQAAAKLLGREGREPTSNGEVPRQGDGSGQRGEKDAAAAADPFEREWLEKCRCGAARKLDAWSCFTTNEGGCGMFPVCPRECGGSLFLRGSSRESGEKLWECLKHGCSFRRNYVVSTPNKDVSNPVASQSKRTETVPLTKEQKKRIAANKAAALARRRARAVMQKRTADSAVFGGVVTPSPVSSSIQSATNNVVGHEAAAALSEHINGVAGRGTKRSHDTSTGYDVATGE